jgi:hypothetical protein
MRSSRMWMRSRSRVDEIEPGVDEIKSRVDKI